jgi:hypothetical protein
MGGTSALEAVIKERNIMPKNAQSALAALNEFEQETQRRFAELAGELDFSTAEHQAIEELHNVYKLAERAKALVDDVSFQPSHVVVSKNEHEDLFARWLTLETEVRAFLTTVGSFRAAGAARGVTVPAAALQRLTDTFNWVRVDRDDAPTTGGTEGNDDENN